MTKYPDEIALVARLRDEGVPEKDIAARLGVTRKTMWGRVSTWNRRHPTNPLPRPRSRPRVPKHVQVAEMYASGISQEEIARRLGIAVNTVEGHLSHARRRGLRTRPLRPRDTDPGEYYTYLRRKGAAPPRGDVSRALAELTIAQIDTLLREMKPSDDTLAHLLARILKEHLDAKQTPR